MTVRESFRFAFLLTAVAPRAVGRSATGEAPAIADVAEKLNLTSVGDYYKVGQQIRVCVEDSTHGKFLWDPGAVGLSAPAATGCTPPTGARLGNALVDFAPVEGSLPVPGPARDTGVSGGTHHQCHVTMPGGPLSGLKSCHSDVTLRVLKGALDPEALRLHVRQLPDT